MKRFSKYFIIFSMIIMIIFQSYTLSFARSGGGGSGGGGGGGGGGSHSSSTNHSDRSTGKSNPLGNVMFIIFAGVIWQREKIVCKVKVARKSMEANKLIIYLRKIDNNYSKDILNDRVKETYFKMQEAWTNRDVEISKEYMSDSIYNLHSNKLEWMKVRNERNVLSNIKLLDFKPVSIEHYKDNSKDIVWFYIKGSMIDYIINEEKMKLLRGILKVAVLLSFGNL
ncbi:Tim44 domain-containing protein [Clostridium neonatale]|uniref:Tim44-like domain-containing protein n=1 Tax=Clostridium neonatale TaxID=137838 RepID=A0AA86MNK1_9CLOT|nr:conserved hypothetical protein [Clostridium neonatale]